ncbi:MAG: hypothetical protein FWH28_05570 [Clostridiales bacterium]|nr:hypothetical protein [Clostridiales bacterium]
MMEFVQRYLDGTLSRIEFDLDFNDHLKKHYRKMERETGELADCFAFYLAEEGCDVAHGLSDADHKKLIRKQFQEFNAAMSDDIL